jgi:hypothetical protein
VQEYCTVLAAFFQQGKQSKMGLNRLFCFATFFPGEKKSIHIININDLRVFKNYSKQKQSLWA